MQMCKWCGLTREGAHGSGVAASNSWLPPRLTEGRWAYYHYGFSLLLRTRAFVSMIAHIVFSARLVSCFSRGDGAFFFFSFFCCARARYRVGATSRVARPVALPRRRSQDPMPGTLHDRASPLLFLHRTLRYTKNQRGRSPAHHRPADSAGEWVGGTGDGGRVSAILGASAEGVVLDDLVDWGSLCRTVGGVGERGLSDRARREFLPWRTCPISERQPLRLGYKKGEVAGLCFLFLPSRIMGSVFVVWKGDEERRGGSFLPKFEGTVERERGKWNVRE